MLCEIQILVLCVELKRLIRLPRLKILSPVPSRQEVRESTFGITKQTNQTIQTAPCFTKSNDCLNLLSFYLHPFVTPKQSIIIKPLTFFPRLGYSENMIYCVSNRARHHELFTKIEDLC